MAEDGEPAQHVSQGGGSGGGSNGGAKQSPSRSGWPACSARCTQTRVEAVRCCPLRVHACTHVCAKQCVRVRGRLKERTSVRTGMLSRHGTLTAALDRDEAAMAALPAPTEVDAPHGAHHGTRAQNRAHPDAGLNPSADSGRRDGGAGGADRNACPGADGGARAVGRGAGEGGGRGASGDGDGGRGWEGDACSSGEEGRGASGRERIGGAAKHKSHGGGSGRCSRFSMVDEQQVRRGGERACDWVESVTVNVIEWETVIRAHVSRTPCALFFCCCTLMPSGRMCPILF